MISKEGPSGTFSRDASMTERLRRGNRLIENSKKRIWRLGTGCPMFYPSTIRLFAVRRYFVTRSIPMT
jgi:hypothetical protein